LQMKPYLIQTNFWTLQKIIFPCCLSTGKDFVSEKVKTFSTQVHMMIIMDACAWDGAMISCAKFKLFPKNWDVTPWNLSTPLWCTTQLPVSQCSSCINMGVLLYDSIFTTIKYIVCFIPDNRTTLIN
jgi:hypothetical protein